MACLWAQSRKHVFSLVSLARYSSTKTVKKYTSPNPAHCTYGNYSRRRVVGIVLLTVIMLAIPALFIIGPMTNGGSRPIQSMSFVIFLLMPLIGCLSLILFSPPYLVDIDTSAHTLIVDHGWPWKRRRYVCDKTTITHFAAEEIPGRRIGLYCITAYFKIPLRLLIVYMSPDMQDAIDKCTLYATVLGVANKTTKSMVRV